MCLFVRIDTYQSDMCQVRNEVVQQQFLLPESKTDDNGNAMFQSFLSKLFKKESGCTVLTAAMIRETREKMFVFLALFVHAAVRGGTCAFT